MRKRPISKFAVSGQGMVEFALILPVLLLIVMGIFEFGRLMAIVTSISSASREGARYGAAISEDTGSPRYADCIGIRNAAKRVSFLVSLSDGDIDISYERYNSDTGTFSTIYTSCPPATAIRNGDRVAVEVSTTFNVIVPLVNIPSIPLNSRSSRTVLRDVAIGTAVPSTATTGAATATSTPTNTLTPTNTPTSTATSACSISSSSTSIHGKKLDWTLVNDGSQAIITQVSITFPSHKLKKIRFDGKTIWSGSLNSPVTITSFSGSEADRTFPGGGTTKTLRYEFDHNIPQTGYTMSVTFDIGCTVNGSR